MTYQDNISLQDGSGDKRHFTIVPNYILNHSTLWDREVYIQMKRLAGDTGSCWMSQKNLAKQCGISINRLKKSIKYLTEHKWIQHVGQKQIQSAGGIQSSNEYKIIDLWKTNSDFYNKGVSSDDTPNTKGVSPHDQRSIMNVPQGVSSDDTNKDIIKEEQNKEYIEEIYEEYSLNINSRSKLTSSAKKKIETRLNESSVDDLIRAIMNFSRDNWWMTHNAHRGVAWFFNSEDRIDQFLNLEPVDRKEKLNL